MNIKFYLLKNGSTSPLYELVELKHPKVIWLKRLSRSKVLSQRTKQTVYKYPIPTMNVMSRCLGCSLERLISENKAEFMMWTEFIMTLWEYIDLMMSYMFMGAFSKTFVGKSLCFIDNFEELKSAAYQKVSHSINWIMWSWTGGCWVRLVVLDSISPLSPVLLLPSLRLNKFW